MNALIGSDVGANDPAPAPPLDAATIERALVGGDLRAIPPPQRMALVVRICETLGLNPWTNPFAYIELDGKLVLYAKRDATDQLRRLHDVSVVDVRDELLGNDLYKVTTRVRLPSGREDVSTGVLTIAGLKGTALANAIMKCETKSKRRATLAICGLGLLDETEVEDGDRVRELAPTEPPPPPPVRRSVKFPTPTAATVNLPSPPTTAPDDLTRRKAPPADLPSPPAVEAPAALIESLVITDTAYVKPPDGREYFEIHARVEKPGAAPIGYVFLTRDRTVYDLAVSAEGSPATFAITWHKGKRNDGSDCKVIDELVAGG